MGIGSSSGGRGATVVGGMGRLREDLPIYAFIDMHGGGDLLPWLRYAEKTGDHSILDGYIDYKVLPYLCNSGKGKLFTITELVKLRNKERNAMLGALSRKKGKGKSGPNVLDEFNQEGENVGDLKKALKLLDGGGKGGKTESKYRELVWSLDYRGSMGETLVGVCLLNCSDIHNRLVLKLIDMFPKLVNDINISEDYYGLSPLHQAIINQDVPLVSTLLRRGADVSQRCYGAYFCADDQKGGRSDSLEHEYVDLPLENTNYTGKMYFGEYPLHFATCMGHPDCFRILLAHRAAINAQDTNGNTVLHMCIIHEKLEMLRLALEKGANPHLMNKQKLTPLTLAAKLAKKNMFLELLELEKATIWEYGESSRNSFPLKGIDTINYENGDIDDTSALSLAVYGSSKEHLELLDGLLENIVQAKWDAFAQKEWLKSLLFFAFYFLVLFVAFMNRPYSRTTEVETHGSINEYGKAENQPDYNDVDARCHLMHYSSLPWQQGWFRLVCEAFVILQIGLMMYGDISDVRRIGWNKWITILMAFPAKIVFKISWILVIPIVPLRLMCSIDNGFLMADNHLSSAVLVLSSIHFLFYFRALKFIGPFVLMIYTIISTDLTRFIMIYIIFLMGFSQAFYMVFFSCESAIQNNNITIEWENLMVSPQDSFIRTFIMTVGEFMTVYARLDACPTKGMVWIGKAIFLIFELVVRTMQLNMLIAMMTRTYENIKKTKDEYKRQWAKVVLMLEVSIPHKKRLRYLHEYSVPTGIDKVRRSFVVSSKPEVVSDRERIGRKWGQHPKEDVAEERRAHHKGNVSHRATEEGPVPCLVCGEPSPFLHMGVGCRACAVFYRRARNNEGKLKCRGIGGGCAIERDDPTTTCKKCRYEKFLALLSDVNPDALYSPEEAACSTAVPETPILARILKSYEILAKVRAAAEIAAGSNFNVFDQYTANGEVLTACTKSIMDQSSQTLVVALFDFVTSCMDEFAGYAQNHKWQIVQNFFPCFMALDHSYRCAKFFPSDPNKCLCGQTVYMDANGLEYYLSDADTCIDMEMAKMVLRKHIADVRHCVDAMVDTPIDDTELMAAIGLEMWNTAEGLAVLPDEISTLFEAKRSALLAELHVYYASIMGNADYAGRIGRLFMLISVLKSQQPAVRENLEMFRMINVFDEDKLAYKLLRMRI